MSCSWDHLQSLVWALLNQNYIRSAGSAVDRNFKFHLNPLVASKIESCGRIDRPHIYVFLLLFCKMKCVKILKVTWVQVKHCSSFVI
jgi:hypothetical protein